MFPAPPKDDVLDTFVYAATSLEKDLVHLVSQHSSKVDFQNEANVSRSDDIFIFLNGTSRKK
jgi:hypothetical protein